LAERFAKIDGIKNILFPTDFSPESMAVFSYLASIAHEYHRQLTILHVLAPGTGDAKEVAERVRSEMKKASR
jgi:hypothetical protein